MHADKFLKFRKHRLLDPSIVKELLKNEDLSVDDKNSNAFKVVIKNKITVSVSCIFFLLENFIRYLAILNKLRRPTTLPDNLFVNLFLKMMYPIIILLFVKYTDV